MERESGFTIHFKNQRIRVSECIEAKSGYTGIFFRVEHDKNLFLTLDQDEVKEFLKKYEESVWNFRQKQLGEIVLEEHRFQNLCFAEKKNRIGNISRSVLHFRKNWSMLKGFRGRMIFTIMVDELIGVTHIDIDADVTTIIKETKPIFLDIHSVNTKYGEYTIQHTVRMFLDNLLRFAKILTISASIVPPLLFSYQFVAADLINLENMLLAGLASSIPVWALKYGRKHLIRFIMSQVKKTMFEKLI